MMAQERTLPLLLLNLGGEMVYILEQRLQAQRVPEEKAKRVLADICRLLLHERFMVELLVPQPLGHTAALRTFFRDLAHSSIMRLDDDSMSKMWDLMTMAAKLQALRADSPGELLQATLNHIDYIGDRVPAVVAEAESARQALSAFYSRMPSGELQAVRYCILNYLQGLAVRVSLFLKHGLQDMHGRLIIPKDGPVPPGCEVPGTIRIMDGAGREVDSVVHVVHFSSGGQFTSPARDAGPGASTVLGCNMYAEYEDPDGTRLATRRRGSSIAGPSGAPNLSLGVVDAQGRPLHVGREELNMLVAQLLGNRPSPRDPDVAHRLICVSLFGAIPEGEAGPQDAAREPSPSARPGASPRAGPGAGPGTGGMLSIDASGSAGSRSASLQQVLSDLDVNADPGDPTADNTRRHQLTDLWDDLDDEDEELAAEQRPLL